MTAIHRGGARRIIVSDRDGKVVIFQHCLRVAEEPTKERDIAEAARSFLGRGETRFTPAAPFKSRHLCATRRRLRVNDDDAYRLPGDRTLQGEIRVVARDRSFQAFFRGAVTAPMFSARVLGTRAGERNKTRASHRRGLRARFLPSSARGVLAGREPAGVFRAIVLALASSVSRVQSFAGGMASGFLRSSRTRGADIARIRCPRSDETGRGSLNRHRR